MSLKDRIFDEIEKHGVEKQQNPWQPYTGPSGGQGWVNVITGEKRYQDNRPEPGEGMPEEYEGEVPAPEEEAAEALSEQPIDYGDYLEPGDEVTFDDPMTGEEIDAEIVDNVDSETGPRIETEEGETFQATWDELDGIESVVQQEPTDGLPDGWAEPPDEHEELQVGQTVEFYDLDDWEYKQGEVKQVKDWGEDGTYVSVSAEGEDGVTHEFLGDEAADSTNAILTAQEDIFEPDVMEEWEVYDDLPGLDEEVVIYDEVDNEIIEGEVAYRDAQGGTITVEDEEGNSYKVHEDGRYKPLSEQGMDELAIHQTDMLDSERLIPGEPDELAEHEGTLAEIEHPAEGSVAGEVEVIDHDEEGRHLYVGDSEVGIPLDNPDHPLHQAFDVESIENPYDDFDESIVPYLNVGDELVVSDGDTEWTAEVTGTDEDAIQVDGGWMEPEELVEGYAGAEVVMTDADPVPEPPGEETWEEAEHAAVTDFYAGDTVWWEDEDGQPHVAEVSQVQQDGDMLVYNQEIGDTMVDTDQIEGRADTGQEIPESEVNPDYVNTGDTYEIAYRDDDGTVRHASGVVTSEDHHGFSLYTPEGETLHFDNDDFGHEDATASITDQHVGFHGDPEHDPNEADPAEVATEIEEEFGLDHSMDKLPSDRKDELKGTLMKKFGPEPVSKFYELQSGGHGAWKDDSGTAQAEQYERAFRNALDIDAPHRQMGGTYPSRELEAVAATAAELSQRHFEAQFGENHTLYRGTSATGAEKLVADFLEDPEREEYESPLLAINNFTQEQGTANRFEAYGSGYSRGATITHETNPEDVVAMHDHLFTEEGTHDHESEITLRGDIESFDAENIVVNESNYEGAPLGKDPAEWETDEARSFYDFIENNGESILSRAELSEDMVRNALLMEDLLANEHEIYTGGAEFFKQVEQRAPELGIDPDSVKHPAAHDEGFEYPSGITDIDDFQEGMEVEVDADMLHQDPGQAMAYAEVFDVDPERGVRVIGDMGNEEWVEPEQVHEISYSPEPYGEGAEYLGAEEWDPDDFEAGARAYVDSYGSGPVEEATIMDVDEDGTVEVSIDGKSDWFDVTDPTEAARISPHPDFSDAVGGRDVPFEEGQQVHIDEDEPGGIDEVGTIGEPQEHDGKIIYPVLDDNGTVIMEYYGDELVDVATPVEDSDDPDVDLDEAAEEDGVMGEIAEEFTSLGSDDGSDDEHWGVTYEEAAEAHSELSSGDDGYWETYEAAQEALPFDIEDEFEYNGEEWHVADFDPAQSTESTVEIYNEETGESMWMSPYEVAGYMEAGESEGSDDGGSNFDVPDIGETDLVVSNPTYSQIDTGEHVTVDGEVYRVTGVPDEPTGYFSMENDDQEINAQEWEIDELVEPKGGDDDEAEGSDTEDIDADLVGGESVDPQQFSHGEQLTVANEHGDTDDYEVTEVPGTPNSPVTLRATDGSHEILFWPDGEIEPV